MTRDPQASDVLYIKALASPFTVNTIAEGTLEALAKQTELDSIMAKNGGDHEDLLARFTKSGKEAKGF